MIKLGHIEYSNCFPVHARLVRAPVRAGLEIVTGTPAELNTALRTGAIDVAPASSIEYARSAGAYRLLPDFVIASDGPVLSILLESTLPIERLAGVRVKVPTASATSVVLLKILLRLQHGSAVEYDWFDQAAGADPFADGSAAALWIGDVALRRVMPPGRHVYDLGELWRAFTGLPFVFAAWQTAAPPARDDELRGLLAALHESHAYFRTHAAALAAEQASGFGLTADRLLAYWNSLRYGFDESMQNGLLEYYRLAAQIGEAPAVDRLRWIR